MTDQKGRPHEEKGPLAEVDKDQTEDTAEGGVEPEARPHEEEGPLAEVDEDDGSDPEGETSDARGPRHGAGP